MNKDRNTTWIIFLLLNCSPSWKSLFCDIWVETYPPNCLFPKYFMVAMQRTSFALYFLSSSNQCINSSIFLNPQPIPIYYSALFMPSFVLDCLPSWKSLKCALSFLNQVLNFLFSEEFQGTIQCDSFALYFLSSWKCCIQITNFQKIQ